MGFLIVFALLLPATAFSSTWTLEECIARGLNHNPEIKAYELSVKEGGYEIHEAWGEFLPTLSLNYSMTELQNGNSSERDTDYLDQNNNNFSCRLTQPLFSGFSGVAGLKRARQSKEYREAELQYMQQQLVREITTSFYSALHARQLSDQWQTSIIRLQQQRDIARAWVSQQLAPKLRLLEVDVELSNAHHQLIMAQSEYEIAIAQLNEWLALQQPNELLPDDQQRLEADAEAPCGTLEDCIDQALLNRAEIKLARLNVLMARQEAKIILGRNLPQAQIDASWVDYQRDYSQKNYTDDERDYYSLTLNLSMKPFQGGRTLSAWRKKRVAVERFEQMENTRRHAITTEVQTRYQQLLESQARIDNVNNALLEANEAYNLALRSAEMGVVSLDQLLDSELRLTRTEINLVDAEYALMQSRNLLLYAVGMSGSNSR